MRAWLGLLLIGVLVPHAPARASETTYLGLKLGYPAMTLQLDPRLKPDLGSTVALGFEMWRTLRDLPLGLGVHSTLFSGGGFGALPLVQTGASLYYFPRSRPASNYSINDEVVVDSTSWSPYLRFSPGLNYMNIRNPEFGAIFGSSSLMVAVALGVLLPSKSTNIWAIDLTYSTSMNAIDPTKSPIVMSGYLLSVAYNLGLP